MLLRPTMKLPILYLNLLYPVNSVSTRIFIFLIGFTIWRVGEFVRASGITCDVFALIDWGFVLPSSEHFELSYANTLFGAILT